MNLPVIFAEDVSYATENQESLDETWNPEHHNESSNSESDLEGEPRMTSSTSMTADIEVQEHHVPEGMEISGPSSIQRNKRRKNSRWGIRDEGNWERNVIKKRRYDCVPYTTKSGHELIKNTKPIDCSKCRFKCSDNFSEEERTAICIRYWSLANYQRQKDFILKYVKQNDPRRRKCDVESKRRKISRSYHFQKDDFEIRVCQAFFEKTLCISNGPINLAFSCSSDGVFTGCDKRGKKTPHNKTKEEDLKFVRSHIETFPAVESHYCRKENNRKYLDSKLSIMKMFQLYEIQCAENNINPVSSAVYRSVFCKEYNLSFFVPRKDQCALCNKFNELKKNGTLTMETTKTFEDHINRKTDAQNAKEVDKIRSNTDPGFLSATVDLQSVLQLPSGEESLLYYTRKLCVYNLTIYESKLPNEAYCFMWTELDGKRGSCEVGSAIKKWIDELPKTVTHLSLFSDTCAGQNRNQHLAALFQFMVQTTDLHVIEQKYLESGHSQMEVDSMHSAIENEKKYRSCYTVTDWMNIMRSARSSRKRKDVNPYHVKQLRYTDFYDLKALSAKLISNRIKDENGEKVNWLRIKMLKFSKSMPSVIEFSYDYDEKNYKKIHTSSRGRQPRITKEIIQPCYKTLLPLSKEKKKDLVKLCEKGIIPQELHPWYKSLPEASNKRDCMPEPGVDDDEDEIMKE